MFATFTGPLSALHRLRAARLHAGDGAHRADAGGEWLDRSRPGEILMAPTARAVIDAVVHTLRGEVDAAWPRGSGLARVA